MISDTELATLSQAVFLRLSYFQAVSYANILAESSIRYPVAEYLERRLFYNRIVLEYTNPIFKKRRCDLYVDKGVADKTIFEFKYVRDNTSYEFQDYFDDILRLHYLHLTGIQSLFIVCGDALNFNNQFRSIKKRSKLLGSKKSRPSGLFSQVLSFSTNKPKMNVDTNKFLANYKDFCSHYEFNDPLAIHPISMVVQTRLICIIHNEGPQSVGVWEVK